MGRNVIKDEKNATRLREIPYLEASDASDFKVNQVELMASTRLVIVDDHEVARRSIRAVLFGVPDLEVVWEAANGEEVVEKARELKPDIVLVDISLPGISGIEAARRIREVSPESRIVFVSQHDSITIAKDAIAVGGSGYVVKSDAARDLLAAIEAAKEGRLFVSRTLIARGWNC